MREAKAVGLRCIGGPPAPAENVVRTLEGLLQQARDGRIRGIAYVTALHEPFESGLAVQHDGDYSRLVIMQAVIPELVEVMRCLMAEFGELADLPELTEPKPAEDIEVYQAPPTALPSGDPEPTE